MVECVKAWSQAGPCSNQVLQDLLLLWPGMSFGTALSSRFPHGNRNNSIPKFSMKSIHVLNICNGPESSWRDRFTFIHSQIFGENLLCARPLK